MNNNITLSEFFMSVSTQLANLSQTFQKFASNGAANLSTNASNGSGKKKKKKVVQDPNAPKKPLSSYLQFCIHRQPEVKVKNPQATFSEVSKIIGQEWQNMTQEKKKKWIDKEEAQKKEYIIKLTEYNKKNGLPAPFSSSGSSKSKPQKSAEVKTSDRSDKSIISSSSDTDDDVGDDESSSDVVENKNNHYNAKHSSGKSDKVTTAKRGNPVSTKREYSDSNSDDSSSDSDEPVQQKKKKN